MRRRGFIAVGFGSLALPFLARAQRPAKPPTLGLLYPNPTATVTAAGSLMDFYVAVLKNLGWIAGGNLLIENASAEGREDRLPALAAELVKKKVDVIWVAGPEAALAAARATNAIPIAFYGVGYPVEQGFVASLAKPGRNVTGVASFAGLERPKTVELLREAVPTATRLSWINVETVVPTLEGGRVSVLQEHLEAAAARLGFELRRHPVSKREDFAAAFSEIRDARAQAMGVDFTALTFRERQRISEFAVGHRLPTAHGASEFVEAGGLLSYGASRAAMAIQSFTFVDRILRGAKPADLPVELPSKFELAVNQTTAKALGVKIPQSLMIRADRVIE